MSKYLFKTIDTSKDRCESGKAAKVNVSLPTTPTNTGFLEKRISFLKTLSNRRFRPAIGGRIFEDLEDQADEEDRSPGKICISILIRRFGYSGIPSQLQILQHTLDLGDGFAKAPIPRDNDGSRDVTFGGNHRTRVFGWYLYVEGLTGTDHVRIYTAFEPVFDRLMQSLRPAISGWR